MQHGEFPLCNPRRADKAASVVDNPDNPDNADNHDNLYNFDNNRYQISYNGDCDRVGFSIARIPTKKGRHKQL